MDKNMRQLSSDDVYTEVGDHGKPKSTPIWMMCVFLACLVGILLLLVYIFSDALGSSGDDEFTNPLFEYVNTPDPAYNWFEIPNSKVLGPGWTGYILNMTSQTWLTPEIVSGNPWWHYLAIVIPDIVKPEFQSKCFLTIGGGSKTTGVPRRGEGNLERAAAMAVATQACGAFLYQVPNQPLYFTAEQPPQPRTEDEIIAYGWNKFLQNTSASEWILRLPMTKAAVRAMDTITDFVYQRVIFPVNVTQFVVAGASKRGWTTWTTGAVDKRVIGIAPIVMDLLNLQANTLHLYQSFGNWSTALVDYWELGLMGKTLDPVFAKLAAIDDPFTYRKQLGRIPKLVIIAAGDEFFQPDDWMYWWDEMPGLKYWRTYPNVGHSLQTVEALSLLVEFAVSMFSGTPFPEYSWTVAPGTGRIDVHTKIAPSKVILWAANSTAGTGMRDFRAAVCPGCTPNNEPWKLSGVTWFIQPESNIINHGTHIQAVLPPPTQSNQWLGFFLQFEFPAPGPAPHIAVNVSTGVSILPQIAPFPPCTNEASCQANLC